MRLPKDFWRNAFLVVADIAIVIASINLALYLYQSFQNTAMDLFLTIFILILAFAYKIFEGLK